MYELISAIGLPKVGVKRWQEIQISNVPMVSIYSTYESVYLTLKSTFNQNVFLTLDLEEIKARASVLNDTLSQFLVSNGNTTLPTVQGKYTIENKYVKYRDAVRSGYKITPVDQNGILNSPIPYPDRDWLALTKQDTDYHRMQSRCLVSVNGMFHLTDTDGNKLLVVDGAKSRRLCGQTNVGIHSFNNVAELDLIPITDSMIHRRYPDIPLSKVMYIDTGLNLNGKTLGIVLGGYLHILDRKTFYRISDSIVAIEFQNYPILERYFESKKYIDLSSLGLDLDENNPDLVNYPQLTSDIVLRKYATLSQSFLVAINSLDIFVEREELPTSKIPGTFISYNKPVYPLFTGYGRVSEYWVTEEKPFWSLNVVNDQMDNYMFQTFDTSNLNNINNVKDPKDPYEYGRGHYLKIGLSLRTLTGN